MFRNNKISTRETLNSFFFFFFKNFRKRMFSKKSKKKTGFKSLYTSQWCEAIGLLNERWATCLGIPFTQTMSRTRALRSAGKFTRRRETVSSSIPRYIIYMIETKNGSIGISIDPLRPFTYNEKKILIQCARHILYLMLPRISNANAYSFILIKEESLYPRSKIFKMLCL